MMFNNLASKTFIVTIIGYLTLISYTWPIGFAPVVSIQVLPILLLGFSVLLFFFLVFFSLLFAPFSWLKDRDFLRMLFYAEPYEDLEEEYKNKDIDIPLVDLILDAKKANTWIGVGYALIAISVLLFLCFYCWYVAADILDNPFSLLFFSPLLWFAYISLIRLISAKGIEELTLPVIGILFFYVIIPTMMFNDENRINPNFLVQKALQIIGAGGGIYAEINPLESHSNDKNLLSGKLLFFDGKRAWYVPCSDQTTIIQTDIKSLSLNDSKSCS